MPPQSYPRPESLSLRGLYCSEELVDETHHPWEPPPTLLEHHLSWEDDELASLLAKQSRPEISPELSESRHGAVQWVLRLHANYGFSAPTAVLAVDYLDRFLSSCPRSRWRRPPWMGQLTAVACLSLAAKVEEASAPLLLDFQAEESACYFFEAKTIKRMELLVLSTLQWRMNPVTPLSFLDHIARRLGSGDPYLCCEFLRRCEDILLSVLPDIRLLQFPPSVVAAATALQVISGSEKPLLGEECRSQLLGILADDKENVESCRKLISEYVALAARSAGSLPRRNKRRCHGSSGSDPGSPRGVVDYVCVEVVDYVCVSSNDSWEAAPLSTSASPVLLRPKKHRS
uniref:Cyclin-D3-like protein n=1 Tax=Lagerstroemia indica TaxID=141186 RepID=A0A7U1GJ20_9MYRT|nr:cyclin-D3-like protein [Lagerstroemia indica]